MAVEDIIQPTIDEPQKVLSAKNITGELIEVEDKIVFLILRWAWDLERIKPRRK